MLRYLAFILLLICPHLQSDDQRLQQLEEKVASLQRQLAWQITFSRGEVAVFDLTQNELVDKYIAGEEWVSLAEFFSVAKTMKKFFSPSEKIFSVAQKLIGARQTSCLRLFLERVTAEETVKLLKRLIEHNNLPPTEVFREIFMKLNELQRRELIHGFLQNYRSQPEIMALILDRLYIPAAWMEFDQFVSLRSGEADSSDSSERFITKLLRTPFNTSASPRTQYRNDPNAWRPQQLDRNLAKNPDDREILMQRFFLQLHIDRANIEYQSFAAQKYEVLTLEKYLRAEVKRSKPSLDALELYKKLLQHISGAKYRLRLLANEETLLPYAEKEIKLYMEAVDVQRAQNLSLYTEVREGVTGEISEEAFQEHRIELMATWEIYREIVKRGFFSQIQNYHLGNMRLLRIQKFFQELRETKDDRLLFWKMEFLDSGDF